MIFMNLILMWSLLSSMAYADCRAVENHDEKSSQTDSTQRRKPSPPRHYEDFGACPFECCTYRQWTVNADTVFYKERSENSPVVFRAKKGEHVVGMTGVVITLQSGKALVKTATTLGAEKHKVRVKAGDVLYVLHYLGEGYSKFWFNGRIYQDQLPSINDRLSPEEKARQVIQPLSEPQTVWWVKVKNKRGQVGWSKQDRHFDGMDACG
ncbi:MAG TPA: hypothetical protein VKB86_17860 [Pyrinomonadaceae bacterium]|nr:hypothetical protein [Pyrinomonadaceae bacterium]